MKKMKVLVAEDDKNTQALYPKGLPEELFEVQIARDGGEAMALYQSWKPDVVVLDIMMPVKTGFDVLREIRENEKGQEEQTVIIMATALSDKSDITDCITLGIQGYIIKPFKFKEIGQKIVEYYKKSIVS